MRSTTRPTKRRHLPSLCVVCLLTGGALSSLSAQTVATWTGGTGNWSNGTLWSTGGVPNGDAFDVFIDGGKTNVLSVVTLDGNYTMGRLTLDAGDTLNVANNVEFTISNGAFAGSGSLVNNGTVNFNSIGNGVYLHFNGASTISGTGTINFNGGNNRVFANNFGDQLTIGAGQTLAGTANLGNGGTNFTNNGLVTANQSGNTLVLQPGGGNTFANAGSGSARAESGGVLELSNGTFSGNSFTALAGSRVQVDSGATVANATLSGVGTGTVTMDGATLNNVTLTGGVSANNNAVVTFGGTLTNNGTFTFNSIGNGVYLAASGSATIAGTGTLNLVGGGDRIFANNAGDQITIGPSQTVAGTGNLGNNGTNFLNQGIITANQSGNALTLQPGGGNTFTNAAAGLARAEGGGVLVLADGTFSGGTFTALTGSQVQINGGATVAAATLASSGTGVVTMDNAILNNVTVAGASAVQFNNNAEPTINGTLTNNGTITFNSIGNGVFLRLGGSATIAGTGTLNLVGGNDRIFANNAGDRLTIGSGQTIAGTGNLGNGGTNFTNNGLVTANQNGNTLLLQPGGGNTFANAGTGSARAEGGGLLELSNGTFSGGTFTALAGSRVQVDGGAVVSGATLASSGTGAVTMDGATLNNVTLAGSVTANNNAEPTASGTLTNNGTFTLNSIGNGVYLHLAGPTTINGTGTISLVGGNDRIFANNAGDRLTIGNGQTIQGMGNVGVGSTTFTNNGTINANQNGGTLTIQPGGGTADFINNGTLSAFLGGTLAFSNASGGTLTNNGTFSVGAGFNSMLTVPAGALTNLNGTTLTGGTYNVTGAGTNSPATLSLGGGSVVTNNARVNLSGAGSVFTEINALANNQGTFSVSNGRNFTTVGALTNSGLLTSASGSNLTVAGNLTNSGLVGTFITTTAATIAVQGTLTSSGTLAVSTNDTVSAATAINVSSAGLLIASGTLTAPTFTLAGALRPGDGINFTTRNVTPFAGSFTLNGQVNLTSTTALVFDLASTAASDQIRINGALTLDGTLTVNALAGFGAGRYDLINYTGTLTNNTLDLGTVPAGYNFAVDLSTAGQVNLVVTTIVPEPSTWASLLAGVGSLAFALRRRVAIRF